MSDITKDHLERLEAAISHRYSMANMAKWVEDNTFHSGRNYSFAEHEFQEFILNDTSREVNVQKCAQVGVSEASGRLALAAVAILSPFTVAYTLPTAGFAGTFAKTRINPVIDGSPKLRALIHRTTDNTEVKRFGDSYLYLRGAASSNAPISIPVDMLIHDEFDFCDMEVIKQYQSRIRHSKYRFVRRFSTPTLPKFGINKEFSDSRRHFNVCKCSHCNHFFIPDYYKNVKIPGYSKSLADLTKYELTKLRWKEAEVLCPSCGKVPDLGPAYREYVCENPSEHYEASGIQVTPFDAPSIMTAPKLVKESTEYNRVQDFVNFGLGLPADDREATLSHEDFNDLFVQAESSGTINVMGVDVGAIYHFVIGAVDAWGRVFVKETVKMPMGKAREAYVELRRRHRPVCTVIDSGPHAETVMALQKSDPNLYASVYMRSKSMMTHTVVDKEGDKDTGMDFLRQVNVNRSRALDGYMEFLRTPGYLKFANCDEERKAEIIAHHCSMKRVRNYDPESDEMSYSWQKTDGVDHFHHAGLYCWIASKIRGIGGPLVDLPLASALKFRLKT